MTTERTSGGWTPTRRAVLGSAVGAGLTSGCVQRVRSLVTRRQPRQLSLSIKTVPADADAAATRIARELADGLEAAGIDPDVTLLSEDQLRRDVLVNEEFDVYVSRSPDWHDPDFLRPLLHSVYINEPGWQNPFGFADLSVNDLLVAQQRHDGARRREDVTALQREITRQQPFWVAAFPDEIGAARVDGIDGWEAFDLHSPLWFLGLRRHDDGPVAPSEFRVAVTDALPTRNLNPLSTSYRDRETITGLLYDSLGRRFDGDVQPWLAAWEFDADESATVATIRLREDLSWHDGTALDADDVAFTYRFLADTTLGDGQTDVPAPRFQGQVSLVEAVRRRDHRTLEFDFGETAPAVALRALTVPILPEHVWASKSSGAALGGIELFDDMTEALVWPNTEPVGSGPLRFTERTEGERLRLERFDDHFLDGAPELRERFGGGPAFEELVVTVAPSGGAAVELAAAGDVDATAASLESEVVPRIGRATDLQLLIDRARSFYHVGFNVRRTPLSNPTFRRVVARLLDRQHVVDDIFDGYATPAVTPFAGTPWLPDDLAWEGTDPEVPFFGEGGDIDAAAARNAFREAGYTYDGDGRLLDH